MTFKRVAIYSLILLSVGIYGCSSSGDSSDSSVNISPSVPDYYLATQEILPIMREASGGDAVVIFQTKATYSTNAIWNNIFKEITDDTLSLDPGVESVFFLIS